jgi:hypothetical protein
MCMDLGEGGYRVRLGEGTSVWAPGLVPVVGGRPLAGAPRSWGGVLSR